MNNRTSLLVIYTGGTIGMVSNPGGALTPFDFGQLYQHIPILKNFNYHIDFVSFDPLIDSSNVDPAFWVKLAQIIGSRYEDYDGFVVLHGTDTMAFSASMLSFMLLNLNKPVVFTGSQLPMGVVRTDGRENFINAVEIAAASDDNTPLVPEVCIYFDNKLFRGNRTTKFNSDNFKAFISGNYPLLAEVGVRIKYHPGAILRPGFKKLSVQPYYNRNVALLKLYPGISAELMQSVTRTPGLKGIVMETYGAGNAPTAKWFIHILAEAIGRGIVILDVTQCHGGSVEMGKYETSAELHEIGVAGGYDITTEAAITKMMFLLGMGYEGAELRRLLQTNLRGEMTV